MDSTHPRSKIPNVLKQESGVGRADKKSVTTINKQTPKDGYNNVHYAYGARRLPILFTCTTSSQSRHRSWWVTPRLNPPKYNETSLSNAVRCEGGLRFYQIKIIKTGIWSEMLLL